MGAHAKLSPSSSKMWLACTPSADLQSQYPDSTSDAAEEGTYAHLVASKLLEAALCNDEDTPTILVEQDLLALLPPVETKRFYSKELLEFVTGYVNRCLAAAEALEQEEGAPPLIWFERRLDYSEWVPEGQGTGDFVAVGRHKIVVRDLKYGRGVHVEAEDNSQLKLYALGAYAAASLIFDELKIVEAGIDQPRTDNIVTVTYEVPKLLDWAEGYLRERAALAHEGRGERVAGEHCRWCKARFDCRAYHAMHADVVNQEFDEPETMAAELSDEELEVLLNKGERVVEYLNALRAWAESEAVAGRRQWKTLKLVEGRSVRRIVDFDTLKERLEPLGFSEDQLYERTPLGLTQLEKLVGKKTLADAAGSCIIKPPGKPTLASVDDKRPVWVPQSKPETDFTERTDDE